LKNITVNLQFSAVFDCVRTNMKQPSKPNSTFRYSN